MLLWHTDAKRRSIIYAKTSITDPTMVVALILRARLKDEYNQLPTPQYCSAVHVPNVRKQVSMRFYQDLSTQTEKAGCFPLFISRIFDSSPTSVGRSENIPRVRSRGLNTLVCLRQNCSLKCSAQRSSL